MGSTGEVEAHSIAVIIPLYNGARYLPHALASVFGQSLPPSEVIVVDDGSTDESYRVACDLQERFAFKLLQKTNGGQSSARNLGVAECTSALVAFLDQDDLWYPHHLATLCRPFADETTDALGWVYANMDIIDHHGDIVHRSYLNRNPQIKHPKTSVIDCLGHDMHILPGATLVRRTAHDAVGGFDERLSGYEDDDYFLRMFAAGYVSHYIDEAVYRWRIHSLSASFSFRMAESRMIYARKLFARYPDNPDIFEFPSRDIIAPRFFPQMLRLFLKESRAGRWKNAEWALAECGYLAKHLSRRPARRIGRAIRFLSLPMVQKASRNKIMASRCRWLMRRAVRHRRQP